MTATASASLAPAALDRARHLLAPALRRAIGGLAPQLRPPLQHHFENSGKHVRAALALLSAAAAGAPEEAGLPGAVAVELVHNFSLLHDDLIDGDRERRHRPTVWAQFGAGAAIVAGDALAVLALQLLLAEGTQAAVRAAMRLAEATQTMIAGQADDMAFERRGQISMEECLAMSAAKTAALLACASSIGAALAGAPAAVVEALEQYGHHLGVAFQAVDDLLGIWGRPAVTGKPVGNDLRQRKKTLPVVAAMMRADGRHTELAAVLAAPRTGADVRRASELVESCGGREATIAVADDNLAAALGALERAQLVAGPAAELAELAHFVVARDR